MIFTSKMVLLSTPSQLTETTVGRPGLLYTQTEEIFVHNEFH